MRVAIGLGASLGDRRGRLELTIRQLAATPGLTFLRGSRWYASPPLAGSAARNWFLNGVALYESTLSIDEVLARCQELEDAAGRRRAKKWADRPLDLDVLLADGLVRGDRQLTLPHPAIGDRAFVLLPLLEVWPDATDRAGRPWARAPLPAGPRPWPVGVARSPVASAPPTS